MARAFVGVGSNLGDRKGFIERARATLRQVRDVTFLRASRIYETDPVGGPKQWKYLNVVWEIETQLAPEEFMKCLLAIEKELGRERKEPNAPRTIDLDLLSWEQQVIDGEGLVVPHPRLQERRFVLEPLADLEPEWRHPVLNKTVRQLLEELRERNP
jgi:2-amino-4-hydroxy-6-hydroxymethyldihydropteridine diphosphokinase